MLDDAELLRRYVETRSEAAFAELVHRHLAFVYAAALRFVAGDAHLAQDVAQTVFTDLARKAAPLANRPVLTGWLYTSARFAAAKAVRSTRRRQTREQAALLMQELTTATTTDAEWEQLRPVIDDALRTLNESDREAVLMRYFEGRAFPEIGLKLSLSADAARLRTERALDKMRAVLARQGVSSTTAALAVALANQPVVAVPAGLAADVIGGALAGATAGGGAAAIFMSMTTLQIGLAVAIVAAGAVGFSVQAKTNDGLRAEIAALRDQQRSLAQFRTDNAALVGDAAEMASLRADSADLARLRDEIAAARRQQSQSVAAARVAPALAPLPAFKASDERMTMRLPDADIGTVLQSIEVFTGWHLVRDPALGRGLVNVRIAEPTPKTQVLETLRTALRDQAGIVLEPGPNGTVLVKRAAVR